MANRRSSPNLDFPWDFFLKACLWGLVLWLPASALMSSLGGDSDLWFHLRTGQWIADHGSVPRTDPFSSYGEGKPLVAYSWLFELVFFWLYQLFGVTAATLLYRFGMAAAISAALFRAIFRRQSPLLLAFALLGLALISVVPSFYERPWLFSLLFSLLTWEAIAAHREGKSTALWFLPLLFALWSNLHIQFVYGLALLAASLIAVPVDRLLSPSSPNLSSRKWKQLAWISLGCFAATFLNPYHYGVYETVLEYANQSALFDTGMVMEFAAPTFRHYSDWAMLALMLGATFVLGRQKRLRSFDILCLGAACFLSFRSGRDRWCVTLVSTFILAESLGQWTRFQRRGSTLWRAEVIPACLALTLVFLYWGDQRQIFRHGLLVDNAFPIRALDFLEKREDSGTIFNPFSFGGYVMWRLPKMKVSMDGRTNVHGAERVLRYDRMMRTGAHWKDDPDLRRAHLVLWPRLSPLTVRLESSSEFKRIYEDPSFTVFERIAFQ